MTGKSCLCANGTPVRFRPRPTPSLSSPRYANPNTHRGYTGALDRLLAQLGVSYPLAEAIGGGTGRPA